MNPLHHVREHPVKDERPPVETRLNCLHLDPVFEHLIARSSMYCYSIDYRSGRFRYVGPGIKRVLGYDRAAWQFEGPRAAFTYVHPEDQGCVKRLYGEIHRELNRYPAQACSDLSFAYTCRMRASDGRYVHLNHHLTFPQLDTIGRPLADFTIVSDITALKAATTCLLHVRGASPDGSQSRRTTPFTSRKISDFSRREMDVLRLVAEGFSSQEIGRRLFISYNTVCTHRKNLMKKAGVNTTVDLLKYARGVGLVK